MGNPHLYPLIDRVLDGQLASLLTRWRAEGLSYESIARRLASEHDVSVTAMTVRRWFTDRNLDVTKAAS